MRRNGRPAMYVKVGASLRRSISVATTFFMLLPVLGCSSGSITVNAINETSTSYVLQLAGFGLDRTFVLGPNGAGIAVIPGTTNNSIVRARQLTLDCRLVDGDGRPAELPATGSVGLRLTNAGIVADPTVVGAPTTQLIPSTACTGSAPPTGLP